MTTNAHIERARTWLLQERADLAEPELRRALALDPEDARAHTMLSFCLAALQREEEALADAERAIGLASRLGEGAFGACQRATGAAPGA